MWAVPTVWLPLSFSRVSTTSLSAGIWSTSLNKLFKQYNFQKTCWIWERQTLGKAQNTNPFSSSLGCYYVTEQHQTSLETVIMEHHPSSSPSSRDSSTSHRWDFIDRSEQQHRFITKSTKDFPLRWMVSSLRRKRVSQSLCHVPVIWTL